MVDDGDVALHVHGPTGGHVLPVDSGGSAVVELAAGDTYELRVSAVRKRVGELTLPMLAYNGSIPGPTLRVRQGSEVFVEVVNGTAMDTTVHWHGLRLENRYDGVPHETQAPIPPGGRFTHRLRFPDAGLFWYHPHVREDVTQELGLYGNVLVDPLDATYWPPADRGVILTLDDLLVEDGAIAGFDPHVASYAAMGRFGNVLLVGGEVEPRLELSRGEVVRLYLTNTANTRVFRVSLPGARMKLVGGDAGRHEREEWVSDVVIAPSERAVIDVLFETAGSFALQHTTPQRTSVLAGITVRDVPPGAGAPAFATLRENADMVAERRRCERFIAADPDRTLALVAEMDDIAPAGDGPVVYACPMHPEVVSSEPGSCPKCGMKLLVAPAGATPAPSGMPGMAAMAAEHGASHDHEAGMAGTSAEHEAGHGHGAGHDHEAGMADGIEWEDLMPEVNRASTSATMRWRIVDRDTGKSNADIDWHLSVGDQVKIRVINEMDSDHPMHHPFHIHGQRFLVLARNGAVEPNLVWKDTVLIRTGEVVDLLMDASNPGLWMAHCHIAEHMETGMMFSFSVAR